MDAEWALFLKLNQASAQIGFFFDYHTLREIKNAAMKYDSASAIMKRTGIIIDWHCCDSELTADGLLKLRSVRFVSTQNGKRFTASHRCKDGDWFSVDPTHSTNQCATRDGFGCEFHPVVPGTTQRLAMCGFAVHFADKIEALICDISDVGRQLLGAEFDEPRAQQLTLHTFPVDVLSDTSAVCELCLQPRCLCVRSYLYVQFWVQIRFLSIFRYCVFIVSDIQRNIDESGFVFEEATSR